MWDRCQENDWKSHQLHCITPKDRLLRVLNLLTTSMREAQKQWDSATVVRLGMQCMIDLKYCRFLDQNVQDNAENALFEFLARSYSRQNQWAMAMQFYDRAIVVNDRMKDFTRKGRCLYGKAQMQMSLGRYDDAKIVYQAVDDIGRESGDFELYGKASLGLSRVAKKSGNVEKAMELAYEAKKAAGLLLDNQWGQNRLEVEAVILIIELSDIQATDFDDTLIEKALLLGAAVDADPREGGSLHSLQAMELQGRRQMFMGQHQDSAKTFAQLLVQAKQSDYRQVPDVSKMVTRVTQHLKVLVDIGVVDVRV